MTDASQAPATKGDLLLFKEEILREFHAYVPATKQDIEMLMDQIGKIDDKVDNLYEANEEWKDEMIHEFHVHVPATKQDIEMMMEGQAKMYDAMQEWKDEIVHEFYIVKEDIRHDAFGSQKDRIEDHEDRIVCLEKQQGPRY
jgi:hypothetical protein